MITGELKSQVDTIWNAFATGGISDPLTVIQQFTFLLFLRRLDESQRLEEKKAHFIGKKLIGSEVSNPSYRIRIDRAQPRSYSVVARARSVSGSG